MLEVIMCEEYRHPEFSEKNLVSGMTNFLFLTSFHFSKIAHSIADI